MLLVRFFGWLWDGEQLLIARGEMYELAEHEEGSGGRWVMHFTDPVTAGVK